MASPFCFRPSPELAERIEEDARVRGVKRSEWLDLAARQMLARDEVAEIQADIERVAYSAPPAEGSTRADAFRAASLRRLGR